VTVKAPTIHHHHRGVPLKSAKDRMDIIAAYQELGSYRAAADLCRTTHKTVKRVMDKFEAEQAGDPPAVRAEREPNYDAVADLVAERVAKSQGRMSAKRMLPIARAAGYAGSDRNFRRLVAEAKALWRREHHRGRRPAVWSPGQYPFPSPRPQRSRIKAILRAATRSPHPCYRIDTQALPEAPTKHPSTKQLASDTRSIEGGPPVWLLRPGASIDTGSVLNADQETLGRVATQRSATGGLPG